ncbi:MAG TPA: T9SS type A sorting domain-containing protein, partial [Bacteroidia bacterium]|nr:T9SS type A sorting domain-containing protein [Bacteroidia bacterium]
STTVPFGSTTLTNAGSNDIYVAKYDASGNALWAKSVGGSLDDRGNAISLDAYANAYVTGYFASSSVAFGSAILTNAGGNDVFLAKLDSTSSSGIAEQGDHNLALSVYPNPNNGIFTVRTENIPHGAANITITDVLGREVYKMTANSNGQQNTQIDLRGQANGIYYITLQADEKKYQSKIILNN